MRERARRLYRDGSLNVPVGVVTEARELPELEGSETLSMLSEKRDLSDNG